MMSINILQMPVSHFGSILWTSLKAIESLIEREREREEALKKKKIHKVTTQMAEFNSQTRIVSSNFIFASNFINVFTINIFEQVNIYSLQFFLFLS